MTSPKHGQQSHQLTAHLLLLAVVAVWGATFALVKSALSFATPLAFNLARMTLAFAVLLLIHRPALHTLRDRTTLAYGAVAGLFLGLGYQCQTAGLRLTTPAKSAFITGLVVVLVPLLSAIPGIRSPADRRPALSAFAGALVAFAGLVLLTTLPGSGFDLLSGMHRGEWLSLGCALAFAFHLLTLSRAAPHVGARALGTLQIGFCALVMLITLPLGGQPVLHVNSIVALALAITALLGTAAAFTIQSYAQQHLPATRTALILTLEPVFAWLTSLFWLGEGLGTRSLAGAGLILAGLLLAELTPAAKPAQTNFAANP